MRVSDLAVQSLFGLAAGGALFASGFKRLKLKKDVEGLATSKIRSLAVGTVEIAGRTVCFKPLRDPIYNEPCVYFDVRVEELRNSGNKQHWVTLYYNSSGAIPFYVEDATGRVLVTPAGAELHLSGRIVAMSGGFGLTTGGSYPPDAFLKKFGSVGTRRLVAYVVREGFPIYVLGYVHPARSAAPSWRVSLVAAAQKLKARADLMAGLDTNRDGRLDAEEWDVGVRDFQRRIETENFQKDAAAAPPASGDCPLMVGKGPNNLLVLADTEEDLVVKLGRGWIWQVAIGAALIVAAAAGIAASLFA